MRETINHTHSSAYLKDDFETIPFKEIWIFVTFCSFFITLFTNHILLHKVVGFVVLVWRFDPLWRSSAKFFRVFFKKKKKMKKVEFLENVWFYLINPTFSKKFNFFHLFLCFEKIWQKLPEFLHQGSNLGVRLYLFVC